MQVKAKGRETPRENSREREEKSGSERNQNEAGKKREGRRRIIKARGIKKKNKGRSLREKRAKQGVAGTRQMVGQNSDRGSEERREGEA